MDLFDVRGGTINLTKSAFAVSGADTLYATTGTQTFAIKGKIYTTAADAGVEISDTDHRTGDAFLTLDNAKQCLFVVGWIAAGTIVTCQGPIVNTADVVNKSAALDFPSIPDTMCPFAYFSVANANATTWLFGTGLWDASDLTVGTVIDVMLLPPQPETAATA